MCNIYEEMSPPPQFHPWLLIQKRFKKHLLNTLLNDLYKLICLCCITINKYQECGWFSVNVRFNIFTMYFLYFY